MQTWAKRGMQAALVTGGMLAAGTGAASASEDCPERPTSPLGGSKLTPLEALGDGTPRSSGLCYSGELFPEEIGSVPGEGGRHARTVLSGTIDPVRDLLPAVEDALTQQIPRIRDEGPEPLAGHGTAPVANGAADRLWIPSKEVDRVADRMRTLELAGWVADTAQPGGSVTGDTGTITVPGHPSAAVGLLSREEERGRHAVQRKFGTPADGYHRSLRWSGPIGTVVDSAVDASGGLLVSTQREQLPPPLVRPTVDPAVVEGFNEAESLTALWETARGRGASAPLSPNPASEAPAGLLSTRTVDLTSGFLGGGPALHTVPDDLLGSAMSMSARPVEAAQPEFVPLQVPGEDLMKANEVPNLEGVGAARSSRGAAPAGGRDAGVVLPLPGPGEVHTLGGGEIGVPGSNRIAEALDGDRHTPDQRGPDEQITRFAGAPHRLAVTTTVVDELSAVVPERDMVTRNPFREAPAARTAPAGGMALPVLGVVPDVSVVQDQTLPLPAVDADGIPAQRTLDTAAVQRA